MPQTPPDPHSCPRCNGTLRRVRRPAGAGGDAGVTAATGGAAALRRYRCTAPDCDWDGLLPRRVRRVRRPSRLAFSRWLRPVLVPGLALAGLGLFAAVGVTRRARKA